MQRVSEKKTDKSIQRKQIVRGLIEKKTDKRK